MGNKKCRIYAACGVSQTPKSAIKLREGKTVDYLKEKFRTYKASDLINAYMAEATVKVLYARYTTQRNEKN